MSSTDETLLCRYHYDPLDRLADCTPSAQARTQRFYLKERLTSEIQGSVQRSIFQQDDQLLAQQQRQDGVVETTLLGTDPQRSVLHALDATQPHPLAYPLRSSRCAKRLAQPARLQRRTAGPGDRALFIGEWLSGV